MTTVSVIDRYRSDRSGVPNPNLGWNTYGVGVESMGRDGTPEPIDVPPTASNQVLVRVDAVGLCFSDVKLIRQGGDHPKLYGRDLATEPTRLGHEAAVTVVDVGDELRDRYYPGQRLAIQPDIHVGGRSTAYGYTVPGGLIQYHLLGPEVLDADDGAYVIPVDPAIGYAAAALSEPWACVEAAYTQRRRLEPLAGGVMWIVGRPEDDVAYTFGSVLALPAVIVLSDVPPQVAAAVGGERRKGSVVHVRDGVAPDGYRQLSDGITDGAGFDDIVMLGITSSHQVEAAAKLIGFRGTLNLVSDRPLDAAPSIDVGRIHYHYTAYLGNPGPDVSASYGERRNRCEFRQGGVALFVGAGGPMGQMHIQRAIELDDGPSTLIASDVDDGRLDVVRERLMPMAEARGRTLFVVNAASEPGILDGTVRQATGGRGADDVVVCVPNAGLMGDAATLLAPDGMLVCFAGVPTGSYAPLALTQTYLGNAQFTGTSGSHIADQETVLGKALAGLLSPERAVAAVGGIEAGRDGVQAMLDARFAGKIVIFPQLTGLGLLGLEELAERYPVIGGRLAGGGAWSRDAEAALIEMFWQGG